MGDMRREAAEIFAAGGNTMPQRENDRKPVAEIADERYHPHPRMVPDGIGAVAQLGERLNRIQEVESSILFCSTERKAEASRCLGFVRFGRNSCRTMPPR